MVSRQDFLATLEQTERFSPEELATYRHRLLARAGAHARDHVPAYRERLKPLFAADGTFRLEAWGDLPILTKDELRAGGDAFIAGDTPDHLKPVTWSATTGSTGTPLRVAKTRLAEDIAVCFGERRNIWHGLDPTLTHAHLRFTAPGRADHPGGFSARGWSMRDPGGRYELLSAATPLDGQIEWLRRVRPAYLTTYPSIAVEIAERAGRSLGIAKVLTFGETLGASQRAAITEGLGAGAIDTYSANETGFVATSCPAGGYHIMAEGVFVEILDEAGAAVAGGGIGRVVVTPFYNTVMPLMRYSVGDYAETLEGPCPCGRSLPRLKAVAGRSRNLFRFVDGSSRWPNLHPGELQKHVGLRQFQVIQHGPADVELRFVPRPDRPHLDLDGLQALARRDLHPSVTIRATPVAEIARGPGGKFEHYLSLIA